ncbi:MAG: phosphoglycerate dehydrogenase-like enzyme [Halieaceae bacterium]|jgi:phosphoglycerate dehydrogenase-like enzyme
MMDLLVVAPGAAALEEALRGRLPPEVRASFFSDPLQVPDAALQAEIALGAPDLLAPLTENMPALRWVQSTWAGITPFLQTRRRNYQLTGVKNIFGVAMSEYVLGWLLALERSILQHAASQSWNFCRDRGLSNLSLGIAGMGNIGEEVARRCRPFVREVVGLSTRGAAVDACAVCFASSERLTFARGLDALVLLLPDVPGTDRLVDAALLDCLRPGAILINAGRANALHMPAVLDALDRGGLSAAVLDVLPQEPLPDTDPLWSHPGLYITSHTAAPTRTIDIVQVFLDNLDCYRSGSALCGLIDFERGY